jgi:putative protease
MAAAWAQGVGRPVGAVEGMAAAVVSPGVGGWPELLAPAGDWECARAAVENGADAIYFGLDRFNARIRANNFTEADLPRLMDYLHRRGVRGYVSFNTLVFTEELPEAVQHLRAIIAAGVDAAIVQDVGICRLIRRLSPDFPIHASTQMTVTSLAGVEMARELDCGLVVLARECSIREIERIQAGQRNREAEHGQRPLPLEVFVHGALCVAYSGQCLTSESLGGRSANRGECAQACRLPYELVADGRKVDLGDRRYLLSPQDLSSLDLLPELIEAGIASLKIEGRLKSPEYVASITRVYRQALDRLRQEASVSPAGRVSDGLQQAIQQMAVETRYEREMAFSRGLYSGWLRGMNNQELVHGRFGKKRGVYLGEISRLAGARVFLRLKGPVKPGDGVVFDAGQPESPEEGGRVYSVESLGADAVLEFGRGDVDLRRLRVGNRVWKTSDPELERRLRRSFEGDQPRFLRPLSGEIHGQPGQPLTVILRDDAGHVAMAHSQMPLISAERQPLTAERIRQQLARLGGTPFSLGRMVSQVSGEIMLPVSELNRLRRVLVQELLDQRAKPPRWTLTDRPLEELIARSGLPGQVQRIGATARASKPVSEHDQDSAPPADSSPAGTEHARSEAAWVSAASLPAPALSVLVRDLDQLAAVVSQTAVTLIYGEFDDPKKYGEAVALARHRHGRDHASPTRRPPRPELFLAPPRISKPGEDWILRQVRAADPDGYLVRNCDQLAYFSGCRCVGDYSLNVANPLTAEFFLSRFGLEWLTASYDLNGVQLGALLQRAPAAWFEITLHQHMPMFHMEHCVFCAFLSKGTDFTNCGRPCDRSQVFLRDRVGAEHPVRADAGCRNTVYNALAQTGAEAVPMLRQHGVARFRLEFLNESPETVVRTIACYQRLLDGEWSGSQLWRELKIANRLGVTRGPKEAAPNL